MKVSLLISLNVASAYNGHINVWTTCPIDSLQGPFVSGEKYRITSHIECTKDPYGGNIFTSTVEFIGPKGTYSTGKVETIDFDKLNKDQVNLKQEWTLPSNIPPGKYNAVVHVYHEPEHKEYDTKNGSTFTVITEMGTPEPSSYSRTNEYWDTATAVKASCAARSQNANCPSSDSCVNCIGKCYSAGTYTIEGENYICSEGKWKQDTSSSKTPKIISPVNGQNMPKVCYDPSRWSFVWTPVSGATNYELYVQRQGSIKPLIDITTPSFTYDWEKRGGVIEDDVLSGWQCKVRAYVNGAWGAYSNIVSFNVDICDKTPSGYARTNDYWDTVTASTASCAPGSASATCYTQDSCVSCKGTCYKPGTYSISGGSFTCSGGKWKQAGYPRTNEYWDTATAGKSSCTAGSKQATCSSPDSCVSCGSKCYPAGTHSINGENYLCVQGKWRWIPSGYPRTNEYWDISIAGCTPGSSSATCETQDSCVSCKGTCYKPGTYPISGGSFTCSGGKWSSAQPAQPSGYPRTNEYWDISIAGCTPGSIRTTCSSADSCVGCNGQCYAPGSKPYPDVVCTGGKWARPQGSGDSPEPKQPEPKQPECPPGCAVVISTGECICGPAEPKQPEQCPQGYWYNSTTGKCELTY